MLGVLQRSDVVAMLATFGDRQPEQVTETIDSMELVWLIHQIEERFGDLSLDDDKLDRMSTITGVLDVLKSLRAGSAYD
jgi:acyl carrier protein